MTITKWIFASLACLPLAAHAQANDAFRSLKILPAPKEVRMAEGRIVIKPSTTILISNAEDRTAAETLQKEIHDRTGMKLSIDLATAAPKTTGHISLGRLTDRGLRSYLESQGARVVLWRADAPPVAAPGRPGRKDVRYSGSGHPRLAQHGMAGRVGRH